MVENINPQQITFRQHIAYICSRLLAYGLPLVFFLVAASFYLKTYDSAQVKITFVQMGTTILLFIWFLKILVEGRLPFRRADMVYVAPFLAWLGWGMLSFFRAPYQGWPMEEALRRFFYIILALITIAELRSEERMTRLWRWLLAAAFLTTGYGLVQYIDTRFFAGQAGIDPFIWRQAFGHRVFSTFGNPNFYGNFLVIVTPLVFALVLRSKGSLMRLFVVGLITLMLAYIINKVYLGLLGSYDESFKVVYGALSVFLFFTLCFGFVWRTSHSGKLVAFLILISLVFLNLYSTETKGAWLGFMAAVAITMMLILEFFLHLEEKEVNIKPYLFYLVVIFGAFFFVLSAMTKAFIMPLLAKEIERVGFSILWIPTVAAMILSLAVLLWSLKKPWHMKKVVYGFLVLFVITMGGLVLQYAKTRLRSVSFRLFTWISTWEMVRTAPIMGNGVGSFKVIYPAFRRPQIIALEQKSNTETDHSEDEYIEVWQDEGIIGFGIFLWLVFTALICGMKQLRWYSRIRPPPEMRKKKRFLELGGDPRSYEVLGILGAYGGALVHWGVDVSIRFVSSGIFSGLLPGLLVAYARNHREPIRTEPRLSYDRWIRVGLAGIWTAIFLGLRMELVPQAFIVQGDTTLGKIIFFCILSGLLIYTIIELLDYKLVPTKTVKFDDFYPVGTNRALIPRFVLIFVLIFGLGSSLKVFANYFQADVHHNLAIFFSKQSIWRKEPKFRNKVNGLPPDIKKRYISEGGALEHYEKVIEKHPGFPMARYFTGNVYNDWGSQEFHKAKQAREKNNPSEADRLFKKAFEIWDKSEEAYNGTKGLAPNYVQIHHQVGLLHLKRAQARSYWGDRANAKKDFTTALDYFYLYRLIDPVFPPNYHRMVEILVSRGKYEEAEKLYEEAIYYNDVVVRQIYNFNFNKRISEIAVALGRVYYTHATKLARNPFNPLLPQVEKAIASFDLAVKENPDNIDGYKGAGRLYSYMGNNAKAQEYLKEAFKRAPNDPELRSSVK